MLFLLFTFTFTSNADYVCVLILYGGAVLEIKHFSSVGYFVEIENEKCDGMPFNLCFELERQEIKYNTEREMHLKKKIHAFVLLIQFGLNDYK